MISAFISFLFVVGIILAIGYFTGNHRFRRRLKSRANDVMTMAGNSIGDVVDDMNSVIEERRVAHQELMSKMASLQAKIVSLQDKHRFAVANADKYGKLAEVAVQQGSDEDATKMLNLQSEQESQAKKLLVDVESLEKTYEETKTVLTNSMSELEKAQQEKESFAARHASIQMREDMVSAVSAFGGQGKLDFSSITNELNEREAKLNARNQIAGDVSGEDAVKRLEASVANEVVKSRLEALKQKAGK